MYVGYGTFIDMLFYILKPIRVDYLINSKSWYNLEHKKLNPPWSRPIFSSRLALSDPVSITMDITCQPPFLTSGAFHLV